MECLLVSNEMLEASNFTSGTCVMRNTEEFIVFGEGYTKGCLSPLKEL